MHNCNFNVICYCKSVVELLEEIKTVLNKCGRLKGREIAKSIGTSKKKVNALLHQYSKIFEQDDEYKWSLLKTFHQDVFISGSTWVTANSFESNLKSNGCLLSDNLHSITFHFPENCKILLVVGARLIALTNQLALQGKRVGLNFSKCKNTSQYLSRLGFFDYLDININIIPAFNRSESRASLYRGKSKNLLEIAAIDPKQLDPSIPEKLTKKFITHSGENYYTAVFTMFSELIGNIYDHSDSQIEGFAALQKYSGRIQAIVSDSGLGIATTIKGNLEKFYPELFEQYDQNSIETDIFLVQQALSKGGLSRHGPSSSTARGLGLKRSRDFALKYDAETRVRQENFELIIKHSNNGNVKVIVNRDLVRIMGTHICFDFILTNRLDPR